MAEFEFSAEADEDIQGIYRYTAMHFGVGQADRYADQLLSSVIMAARFPLTGRSFTTRAGAALRQYNVGRHAIFYRQTRTGILVVRVLHQMMDFDAHLD